MGPLLLAMIAFVPLVQDTPAVSTPQPACIAVLMPAVQGGDGNATDAGIAARDLFVSYLTGPSMNVLPLEAKLQPHGLEEAKSKGCTRMLVASMTRKTNSGGGGSSVGRVIGQAGSSAAWHLPGYGAGAAAARTAAAAGGQAAQEIASGTRAKDEMKVDWKLLMTDGGKPLGAGSEKGKAGSNGEDLLTPIVYRIAEAIVALPVK